MIEHEFPKDAIILSTYPADEEYKEKFRQWIDRRNLTKDDVKMVDRDGSLLIITKRDIKFMEPENEQDLLR